MDSETGSVQLIHIAVSTNISPLTLSCMGCLTNAMSDYNNAHKIVRMNPKAITDSQM